MLSNETISNIRLHRDTRLEPNAAPFLVPTNGGLQVPIVRHARRTATERLASSRSSKSAIDAKNRAVSDSCMAAAIGDLQWLKQSIRDGPIGSGEVTSIEQTYGKEVVLHEDENVPSLINRSVCVFVQGSSSHPSRCFARTIELSFVPC